MADNIFYSIKLLITGNAPVTLFVQQEHDELFISAHGRLCGLDKMVHLDSSELAEKFRYAYIPRFQKRYGKDVFVEIIECGYQRNDKRTMNQITKDSELARKRLETGVLASNQQP